MKTNTASDEQVLQNLWGRTRLSNNGRIAANSDADTWSNEIRLLEQYGKGMEETMRYLYAGQPAYEAFIEWLGPIAEEDEGTSLQEDVLSAADLAFWEENGYVVVRNAVTKEAAAAAADAIWQHLGASPADPATWYRAHEDLRGLMLTFYHHPALVANRRSPRVRKAYEQLYGSTDLHRNIDKVSFNPPVTPSSPFMGSALHWDVSLQLPIPFKMQGLLYLTDTDATNGAFHCVPGFHRNIESWMNSLPAGADPRRTALETLQPIPVIGAAGDFVIWHQALPHCATANRGTAPRLVQYYTYLQKGLKDQDVWI
jgi:ectoine hydroxylase-related dioxygenase (phytanoyl-CoA dioxygenase family)